MEHHRNGSHDTSSSTTLKFASYEIDSRRNSIESEDTVIASPSSSSSSFSPTKAFSRDRGEASTDNIEQAHLLSGTDQNVSPSDSSVKTKRIGKKKEMASWREIPRKDQLALLIISRLSEPLTQTSLQSYMFYQLKSFDSSLQDSEIATQVGWMTAGFTLAQFLTAFAWGRAADSELIGRKRVILIGLLGTMISALGFGFSRSFASAILFRCIGGALNGNVGVMRVMISEIIKEKRFQSRAFMMLPMTFNIGVIIGPMLGGVLSDPVQQYPWLFGPGSMIGGKDGIWWMQRWPYALPNIINAILLLCSSIALFLGLDETHEMLRDRPDRGRQLGKLIMRTIFRRKYYTPYSSIPTSDSPSLSHEDLELQSRPASKPLPRRKLPFSRIWTRNVCVTLISHALLASHVGTFNIMWFTLLSTARYDASSPPYPGYSPSLPLKFTGGLAMPPARIGIALSILGGIGITLQLFLYPSASFRLGTARAYKFSLLLFPAAYLLAPFLAAVPSTSPAPAPAEGPAIWASIASILFIQVLARTFALPSATILINNACPHPSVLGSIHGTAQTVSAGARTVGPAVLGWIYGLGLRRGVVGAAWWVACCVAVGGCFVGAGVREGSGHEVFLEGEEEQELVDQEGVEEKR